MTTRESPTAADGPPSAGSWTRIVTTKWPDRPHWTYPAYYLGADRFGDWFGHPVGTRYTRPGKEVVGTHAMVTLVPGTAAGGTAGGTAAGGTDAAGLGRSFLATFHSPGSPLVNYVDLTTEPVWRGHEVWAVDLDLDVVQAADGRLWIDDEDEFARHQIEFGYPAELITQTRTAADALLAAIDAGQPPFDPATARDWLKVLARLTREDSR